MITETPLLPEVKSSGGTAVALILLALAVTTGIVYWQYQRGDESNEQELES